MGDLLKLNLDNRSTPWLVALLVAALLGLALWQTGSWTRRLGLSDLQESSRQELSRYVLHLQGQLEKFEFLPGVLASNESLVRLLQNPADYQQIEELNRFLATLNRITGTSDTYLMDADGMTIAASNWLSERPFVGKNFSYRPYFQEAMKGRLGRYFALGTTSNKRGYYFAYPVRWEKTILGTVVVKINIAPIERSWETAGAELIVTDPDGVIFITTHKNWRFKTLGNLASEVQGRIKASRRYGDVELVGLPVATIKPLPGEARILETEGPPRVQYLIQEQLMPQAGWKVHLLTKLDKLDTHVFRSQLFAAILIAALVLLILFWVQRRRQLREQAHFERRAKETLESQVKEQTSSITEANIRLTREIEEHRRTESELQGIQNQLIQSAKLAVIGQMSTGISHELNQPLAAIRSYADNALALFERGRQDEVKWNLSQISELTERMAQISSQLKVFARKTSGRTTVVSVSAVIDHSLKLLSSRIKKNQTNIRREHLNSTLLVIADMVQLEQVLVNLIGNALHAVEAEPDPYIVISATASCGGAAVELSIHDNGPGIPDELLGRIFDPFFTTKEEGRGLGLGLSISLRIIEALNGTLTAENHTDGGALFTLELPAARPPAHVPTG